MRTFKQFINEQVHDHVNHFVGYACDHLGIGNPPLLNLINDKEETVRKKTFGYYNPNNETITLNVAGRHTADVLRTLAHELVHHKQNISGELHELSGETGSDHENEANSEAGVIMRNYGRMNPHIFESAESKGSLHAFDVDGTLMHTTARVHVRNEKGDRTASLSHDEFNKHKLQPKHHYDFSEFRSSKQFHKEKPIRPMLAKLKATHKASLSHPNSKVILNTARSDFDDKHHFAKAWAKHGINITPNKENNHIHVERAGNIKGNQTVAEKKATVMRKHLDTGKYKEAHLYDDDHKNIHHFLKLKKEYPNVQFHAHHVQPDGSIKSHNA